MELLQGIGFQEGEGGFAKVICYVVGRKEGVGTVERRFCFRRVEKGRFEGE